jgi:hypothetical protein
MKIDMIPSSLSNRLILRSLHLSLFTAINFAFVPPSQRLLYINTIQIGYNVFLSFLGNKSVDTEEKTVAENASDK